MSEIELLLLFIISSALGGLIGVQVERNEKRLFTPGIRTHIIVALLGTLSAVLFTQFSMTYIVYAIFASIILFVMHENIAKTKRLNIFENSFLYEILIVISFICGLLIGSGATYIAVFIAVFISILLYTTPHLHNFSKNISREEIHSTLLFICISAILLPILPNKSYDLTQIKYISSFLPEHFIEALSTISNLNPFIIWSLVVVISALSFTSYVTMKILGEKKGLFLTGLLGGLVSSTALTTSFSISSKTNERLNYLFAGGIILASSIMFFRVFVEILIIAPNLALIMAIPLLITPFVGIGIVYFTFHNYRANLEKHTNLKSPFRIRPALIFGILFTSIIIVSNISLHYFSDMGLYITAVLSGLVDVDAITLSTAQLFRNGTISEFAAIMTISLAVISNTIIKALLTWFLGGFKLFKIASIYFLGLLISYILLLIVVLI
ncbi:MAG: MgtC/SapB family protein [Nanoarchaeota archaeon]|nr:MgtC/SapB family protein [Nanoarchaeota archaeon]